MKRRSEGDKGGKQIGEDDIEAVDVERRSFLGGVGLLAGAIGTAPMIVACGAESDFKADSDTSQDPIDEDRADSGRNRDNVDVTDPVDSDSLDHKDSD